MEHIVQFAIGIDDKAIQNRIEEHAYEDVIHNLEDKAMHSINGGGEYMRDTRIQHMMEAAITGLVDKYKDEIIDKAAEMLADKFSRTKKYREAMGNVIEKDGE